MALFRFDCLSGSRAVSLSSSTLNIWSLICNESWILLHFSRAISAVFLVEPAFSSCTTNRPTVSYVRIIATYIVTKLSFDAYTATNFWEETGSLI